MNMDIISGKQSFLIGRDSSLLSNTPLFPNHLIHSDVVRPLTELYLAARENGFDLKIASGYRSYERQLNIWNAKAQGHKAILDDNGAPLSLSELTPREIVFAILRWSALPGASRHHWGTDFDVYDARSQGQTPLELIPQEYEQGGIQNHFNQWLNDYLLDENHDFFRPYEEDLGGVAPEMWHISHGPTAEHFLGCYSFDFFYDMILASSDLQLQNVVIENAREIYDRFVINIKKSEKSFL